MDQSALLRVARNDNGSRFTAFHPAAAGIQEQSSFDFLRSSAVALVTLLGQHRSDSSLEELNAFVGEVGLFLAHLNSPRHTWEVQRERHNHQSNVNGSCHTSLGQREPQKVPEYCLKSCGRMVDGLAY